MKKYRVVLPIEVDGKIYNFGDTVELDAETAEDYRHAVVPVAAEKKEE